MKLHARIALALAAIAFAAPLRATEFDAGDGSPASPYVIRNAAQLAKFRDIVNGANGETQNKAACARLAADIDLAGAAWTPIGTFAGTFDGQGHTIGGLSVDLQSGGSEVRAGLFGFLGGNATVKDLGVCGDVAARGSGDNTYCFAGGIAGYNLHGTVEGCFHAGSVSADSTKFSFAGGVVGNNNGTVRNCRHAGSVSSKAPGTVFAGGVVGANYAPEEGAVRNCYAVGAVTATGNDGSKYVGGVAGDNHGTMANCYYDRTVAGAIVAVGGGVTAGATGKTTAEMQGADALSRLDLNAGLDAEAWMATEGYPELKAFVAYPLWIGGAQFTAGNLVIDADDDPGIASGTATYDPASNTLWLTNFVYSGAGLLTNSAHCALYYAAHSPAFVIDVSGTNRLAQSGADEEGYSIGLYFRGESGQGASTVTIRSADGGRLSVAADADSYSYGIYAHYVDLVIDGAAVSAVGGPGLYHSFGAMFDWCSLTIESGSLAAQGGKSTNYNSVGVSLGSTRESLFVKGGSLIATGGEGGWGSYGILGWGSSNPTPLSFTGGETLAQGGTAGIVDASLSVADGLAVSAGADADSAAAVEGDGWKDQKCVRIAPVAYPVWVAGRQVTGANAANVLGDASASVSFAGTATNGTLTLRDAVIEEPFGYVPGQSNYGYIAIYTKSGSNFALTVALEGTNRVGSAEFAYGFKTWSPLTITGGGVLFAVADDVAIFSYPSVLIDGATVFAEGRGSGGRGSRGWGIEASGFAATNATVQATGASVGITANGVWIGGDSTVVAEGGTAALGCYPPENFSLGDALAVLEPAGGTPDLYVPTLGRIFISSGGAAATRVVIGPVEFYPLWVGSVQVCETNQNDILGDGTAWFEGTATNGTLFLSNARITEALEHPGNDGMANIWSDSGFDLTISLSGSNRVECAGSTTHDYCVYAGANLAITGEGTLVAEIPNGNAGGIGGHADLRIDGATVTVSAGDTGLLFGNTLAISNATVTAMGTSNYGIYCSGFNGRIDIADSVVTATGGSKGLYARGTGSSLAVSGSSVVTAVTTSDDNVAFSAGALVLGDGLAVTEPAGGVFGEDGWGSGFVIDPATGAPAKRVVIDRRFAVTVVGGSTTNTTARAGETVTVVADDPEEGKAFVGWSADDAMDVTFATPVAATTTFEMPARAATVTATFKDILIDAIPDQEWTGSAVEPVVRVQLDGVDQVLFAGTDYTVSYTNNVDPGTATATVTMAPPRTGHASVTFQILPPPVPPAVSNVVARQRWPWNGLVDVDYEVGGDTNLLAGVTARITFEERIEGGTGRIWVASNFLAGAEPSVEPGPHRATWDTAADGLTDVVAEVKATVNLVGTGNEKGLELVNKTVIVTPVDPDSDPSCVEVNGNGYLLTNDPEGVGIDFRFGSGCDSAKVGEVVGITLDKDKVKKIFDSPDSLQFVPSEGVKFVDPATGDKVDSLEVNADGSVVFFVTADQVVPGGSITVHGNGKTVVIDNINFYDSVPEGWVGVVVTSAASAEFRLDTREGPRESDGTETLAYSTLWHPAGDATVTILQDGEEEPVAAELAGEGDIVWQVFEDGTYVLVHKTVVETDGPAVSDDESVETATFVVTGHPPVEAALRWKYAKNANGWHCAQVALKWHPSYADEISDMRLLFADRYEGSEPLAVIKVLDDEQAAFFEVPEMIKMAGNDWKYYFLNDENGKVYTERFLESGYREKLVERPTVINGDELGDVTGWASSRDSHSYITNGVLNADGTSFSEDITVNGRTVTIAFASSPRGLGRRTAYLVDPATVVDPLGSTETYRDVEYRVAPVDLTAFAGLADGARAVYGVSDATMASPLDSVPKAERKICLRVVNRDYSTVETVTNKLAILAWNVGGSPRFLPIAETMSSLQDGDDDPEPAPQPAPRPLSVEEANLSTAFGLAPAAVARGAVTCRVSSMSFGEDGSVEGTFAVAAENAGGVVAESGELAGNVKLTVLGAESLGGAFEPLDPSCGAELLSRKPPYAFRVKAPGDNAFFKIRLEAEDVFE